MSRLAIGWIFAVLSVAQVSVAASNVVSSKVDKALATYDQTIKNKKFKFDAKPVDLQNVDWVRSKLEFMYEIDQYMRGYWDVPHIFEFTAAEKKEFDEKFLIRNDQMDSENTTELKVLLQMYTWFKVSEWGVKYDGIAWLIVQHADLDPDFQESILKMLEKLYPLKETSSKNYAYLFDRVAMSFRFPDKQVPQRYGTQGFCVPGKKQWKPHPMEDPKNVDRRRKTVGLEPLAEYIEQISLICP